MTLSKSLALPVPQFPYLQNEANGSIRPRRWLYVSEAQHVKAHSKPSVIIADLYVASLAFHTHPWSALSPVSHYHDLARVQGITCGFYERPAGWS